MKKIFLLSVFAILSLIAHAQDTQDEPNLEKPTQFNEMKSEIGIDFQSIFAGRIGESLVYKRRFGEKNFVSTNEKKAFRFRIGGRGSIAPSDRDTSRIIYDTLLVSANNTVIQNNLDLDSKYAYAFALAGIEWQRQKGRFQYFYGFEAGFLYERDIFTTQFSTRTTITPESSTTEIIAQRRADIAHHTILLNGIVGFKYFFNPRFSLSIESTLDTSFRMSTYKTIREDFENNTNETFINKDKRIFYGFDYLNALYISYYF